VEGHHGQDREGPHAVQAGCAPLRAAGTTSSSRSLPRRQPVRHLPARSNGVDLRRTGK
jgi:hypothetical protein